MNKTIKVIDLLNEVSRGNNLTFKDGGGTYKDSLWTFINMYMDKRQSFKEIQELLNSEVILVEDNTEEIEEIREISDEYFNMISDEAKVKWLKFYINEDRNKINELVKAVNQIRKEKQ